MVVRLMVLSISALVAACASPSGDVAQSGADNAPVIVLTATNMNAHSSHIPALNEKMGEEVASVAALVAEKTEKSGRKVIRRSLEKAAAQDIAQIIRNEQTKPARLVQVYWSVDEGSNVFLNVMSVAIVYSGSSVKFGGDTGKKFKILGPGTYTVTTAEEMAEQFVRAQNR